MQDTTEQTKQYQCRHIFTDGRRCSSPCLRQEEFCYYHHTTRKPIANPRQRRSRRSTFHLPLPEDRSAIQSSIGEVLQRIASNDIDPRRAGLLLYGLQIASLNLPKNQSRAQSNTKAEREAETVEEITIDPTLGILAPRAEVGHAARRKSPVTLLFERMMQSQADAKQATPPQPATIPTLQATADNRAVAYPPSPTPKNRHFDRRRRTCRRSGETRFSTLAGGPYIRWNLYPGCPIHAVSSHDWAFAQSANLLVARTSRLFHEKVTGGPYIRRNLYPGCPIHAVSSHDWAFAQSANLLVAAHVSTLP